MKSVAFSYSVKIWISSVLIAPITFFISSLIQEPLKINQLTGLVPLYGALVALQFVFSLLTWITFWAIIELIVQNIANKIFRNCSIGFIGAGLTVTTFYLFSEAIYGSPPQVGGFGLLMISNCACIVIGTWYFKEDNVKQTSKSIFDNDEKTKE